MLLAETDIEVILDRRIPNDAGSLWRPERTAAGRNVAR